MMSSATRQHWADFHHISVHFCFFFFFFKWSCLATPRKRISRVLFHKKRVRRSRGRCSDLMSKELLMGFYFWRDAHQGLAHPKFKELRDKVSTLIWFSIFRAGKGRLRSKTQSEVFIFSPPWVESLEVDGGCEILTFWKIPPPSVQENLRCVAENCQTVIDDFGRTWNAPRVRAGCGMFLH